MPRHGSDPARSPAPAPSHSGPPSGNLRQRRPSNSTTTDKSTLQALEDTVAATAHTLEKKLTALIHWDDLPPWRRDNPSILRGYRQTSNSLRASLHSLLYVHNETVNVYTHLLGAVAFALGGAYLFHLVRPRYGGASAADVVVFACFFAGGVGCLGMSATYHLLCNHSEEVAKWGNKLDYSGIVFLIVGSYVPALWYGFFCWAGWLTGYLGAVSDPFSLIRCCVEKKS